MSLAGFIKGMILRRSADHARKRLLKEAHQTTVSIERPNWNESLTDPTRFYRKCFQYFHVKLPAEIREHREYFSLNHRGFGEEAFHTMWFLLFAEFPMRDFLEIGVYRGQVLSLASMLQRRFGREGEVVGISPFEPAGDSVSRYMQKIDYLQDTLANFAHFSLPRPGLLKAFSTDPSARELIASRAWECIYIDGNHDYEVAKADWTACAQAVREGGIIVLDDSGLGTSYRPLAFSTKGHPGPSRVADEVDRNQFEEILQVGHNRVFQKKQQA